MYGSENYGTTAYASKRSNIVAYILNAITGVFTLTGIDTAFIFSRTMICETGVFVLTGIDALFNKGYTLVCSVGTFTLTGIDVIFNKGYNLVCGVGSFTLTGLAITFTLIRDGILKPISYIKKININSKVVKKYIISKFK